MCDEYDVKPTIFTYNELRGATRDFHPDMKLGEGGYGAVFKVNQSVVHIRSVVLSREGDFYKLKYSFSCRACCPTQVLWLSNNST